MNVNTATAFLKLGLLLFLVNNIVLVVISNTTNQGGYAQNSDSSASDSLRFSKPVNLTNNLRDSVYAQVASQGDNVYMVWQENPPFPISETTNSVNYDIFMKKSIDGGLTFGKEINLSNNPGFSEHPQIAASGKNVYIVWIDNSPSIGSSEATENKKILFRKSIDGGNTFRKTVILSDIPNADSFNQEIAAAGNNVYIVWQVAPLPTADQDSVDDSSGQDINADNNGDRSSISDDKLSSISFIASVDNGETFKEVNSLSNEAFKSYPKIAAYANDVYIVWNIGIIGDTNDSNNANNNNSNNGIFFTKSFDNGNSFGNLTRLNADWNSIGESQVAAYGNNVYVVWGGDPDHKVPGNLFYTTSPDNGTSFSLPRSLTEKNTLNVEVAADTNSVYIAWQGVLPNDNEEILVKKSTDSGATFSEANENVSKNDGISECTSITISEDTKKVYLAWEDTPAGNHEILFARGL
jgi:uncharacterized protein involved in tolerance to divalent cations